MDTGTMNLGQNLPSTVTYVDGQGNPIGGLQGSGVTIVVDDPTIVSFDFNVVNCSCVFNSKKVGITTGHITDAATGFTDDFTVTVLQVAGGLKILFGTPVTP